MFAALVASVYEDMQKRIGSNAPTFTADIQKARTILFNTPLKFKAGGGEVAKEDVESLKQVATVFEAAAEAVESANEQLASRGMSRLVLVLAWFGLCLCPTSKLITCWLIKFP
jgi:hypothetical protein